MKILLLGAGAWGTALACNAATRHTVTLWARDATQLAKMAAARENARYLPGITLPAELALSAAPSAQLPELAAGHDLVVIATPVAGLRGLLSLLAQCPRPVAWLCKGFEPSVYTNTNINANTSANAPGLLAHELQAQLAPQLIAGALSGPSFALEVARHQPSAVVAASAHESLRNALVQAFHSPSLRVYGNDDLVGVEVGGAVKNVLAIAAGLCDGLALGYNARAALLTRGLAEMTRLGVALGGRSETLMGLAGLGDLILTATGDLSRNRRVGLALAQGQSLAQALAALGHVAEGVACARTVAQRARQLDLEMPITDAVVELLDGSLSPAQAVQALMTRQARSE